MGIATDVFFVEGLFESLKELSVRGSSMHIRDVTGGGVIEPRGYVTMAERVGVTGTPIQNDVKTPDAENSEAFIWKEVPGGVVSTQILIYARSMLRIRGT